MPEDGNQGQAQRVLRGTIGTLSEYQIGNDWCTYEERMEQYFLANYIEDNKKVPVLLTVIGEQAYKVLRDLCDPALPKDKTYRDLCEILRSQFSKKISVFKERIEFYELRQREDESVKDWHVRVKNKAIHCKFGNFLNEVLKDKFISGMYKGPVLDKVCEEEYTTSLDRVLEIALKKEASLIPYSNVNKLSWQRSRIRSTNQDKQEQPSSSKKKDLYKEHSKEKSQREGKEEAKCNSCARDKHNFACCKFRT